MRNWGQTRISAGFTLLEIVVTLLLIGLATALVAPMFRRDALPDDAYSAVVSVARELAVRRAQRLILDVDDRGQWRLSAPGDSTTIGAGILSERVVASRLSLSPLGACFREDGTGSRDWDAVACAPAGGWSR
jgi:prepilin-type N-terminal cleavage/methylation domain-containing protein